MISRINFLPRILWLLGGLCALVAAARAADVDIGLPAGQAGVAYTPYTVAFNPTPPAGTTYAATGLPTGMSINAATGQFSGTPTVSGVFTGVLSLTDGAVTNNFTYSLTIAAALGTPQITSSLTALGAVGSEFVSILSASNSPTSFNVGALPAGLTYDSANTRITGTPTVAGTYQVSLSANNASGTGGVATLVITIEPSGPVPAITSAASVAGDLNVAFSYQIVASNSPTAYSANGLPVGLSLNATSGLISGTPTVPGVTVVNLVASNGNGVSATFALTLTLGPVSAITSSDALPGYVGVALTPYLLTATNTPLSFNVGALPAGLSYSSTTKEITGTPTATGVTPVTITANNGTGTGPAFTLFVRITTATAPVIITQTASQTRNAGDSFTFMVNASGDPLPTYQWKKGEDLIPNATFSSYTLNGLKASDAGTYRVVVTNPAGSVTSDPIVLTVTGGFDAWLAQYFTTEEQGNPSVSGPNVVYGADGLPNLLKYALGLNPKVNATTGLPAVSTTSTHWVYTYTRPSDRPDISYAVEVSTNLSTWTTSGVTHEWVSTVEGVETWRASYPLTGAANAFFRLRITTNANPPTT